MYLIAPLALLAALVSPSRVVRHLPIRGRLRHFHSSSRFDRSGLSMRRLALLWIGWADVLTFTEVGNNARVAFLRRFPGFTLINLEGPNGSDECAMLVKRTKWTVLGKEAPLLSDERIPDRGSRKIRSLDVVLQHNRTKQTGVVSVCHTPAHLEGGGGPEGIFRVDGTPAERQQVKAMRETVDAWGTNARAYLRDHDFVVLTGDLNLNLHRVEVRRWFGGEVKPLRLTWGYNMPPRGEGSHKGGRLIDGSFSNLPVRGKRIFLLDWHPSSDHRAFREVLLLPRVSG